ncbi:MAG: lipocalin-like domain-containing protein [Chitinophagaceae bacterium]|nr:lipocalin-like domain-containing protein [Chitinophagaceae bacterium]
MACNSRTADAESQQPSVPILGTWELISGTTIQNGDTSYTDYRKTQKMIKVINETHFAFLKHDLNKGKDSLSAVFDSGAGPYTLSGNQYTEHLEYCNYREWEGKTFQFTVTVENDTLIQSGLEKVEEAGIDRHIIEKYVRIK